MSGSRTYFLTTDRLGFSHWNEDDLALAMTLWGDPRVSAFIGGPFAAEEVQCAARSRDRNVGRIDKVQYWPVFLLQDGELAGCAGLRPYGDDEQHSGAGISLSARVLGAGPCSGSGTGCDRFAFETIASRVSSRDTTRKTQPQSACSGNSGFAIPTRKSIPRQVCLIPRIC